MQTYIAYILASLFTVFYTENPAHYFCAHDHVRNNDLHYRADSVNFEKGWIAYQESLGMQEGGAASYVIPVVFHIIHNNGPENISMGQVQNALDWLNESMENTGYYDPSTGVDTDIQFCLAQQDPNGNATDGVVRRQSSLTTFNYNNQDLDLKNLSRWNPNDYLNIWVVQEITSNQGSGVAGYAYFPTAHGSDVDGVVVEARYTGTAESDNAILTHEVGHYLGLFHTFQGGCANNDCQLDGDKICDTPPDASTARPPCDQPNNSCQTDVNSGWNTDQDDMISNYMDYSDLFCYSQFTAQQTLRMHYSLDVIRNSLLRSNGCEDPCLNPVSASASHGGGNYYIGDQIDFINQSVNAVSYSWKVNGVEEGQMANFSYVFSTKGIYEIQLEAQGSDLQCRSDTTWIFNVECEAQASYTVNRKEFYTGETLQTNNTSINATDYEWVWDGNSVSNSVDFSTLLANPGSHELYLVASNGVCRDTSIKTVIFVRAAGQPGLGLPQWPLLNRDNGIVRLVDWRFGQGTTRDFASTSTNQGYVGQSGAGYDECGGLKFVVVHNGTNTPNGLFLFGHDGRPLLTDVVQGPGLNAVRGGNEIQVVPVPNTQGEWYIIYNEYQPDAGWPINNAAYAPARILYSRVRMEGDILDVLYRDRVLEAGGVGYTYTDGKAVSRTALGRDDRHYLYATRRAWLARSLSLDRFLITDTDILYDRNTGTVPVDFWNLTFAGSPVELSPTEDRIAVVNRNQSIRTADVIVFDAASFSSATAQVLELGNLEVQPDGGPRDQSNVLNAPIRANQVFTRPSLPLQFLVNMERKVNGVEFSPNGRFLYFSSGGYVAGSFTNLTYIGQIDLDSPAGDEVRLQIQTAPFDNYDPQSGRGCNHSETGCLDNYHNITHIESCFDGNLYFTKRNSSLLYVIPDPNDFMPQNLVPGEIDLSNSTEPNIDIGLPASYIPDQIDGYNYLNFQKKTVYLAIQKLDCDSMCLASYPVVVSDDSPNSNTDTFWITTCPDTLEICVDTNYSYWLEDLRTDTIVQIVEPGARVISRLATDGLDLSERSGCIEICGNGEDDDGDGLIDCDDPDIQNDCCCLEPEEVDLGPDVSVCENGIQLIDAGPGFAAYRWQDGFDQQIYTAFEPGLYWVEVEDTCGNASRDSLLIELIPAPILDLGPDTVVCLGSQITFYRNSSSPWRWYKADIRGCDDCDSLTFQIDSAMLLIAERQYGPGCFSLDTVGVSVIPAPMESDTIYLCPEDTVVYRGRNVTDTVDFEIRLPSSLSCDTILNVVVQSRSEYQQSVDLEVCPGDSANYRGRQYGVGQYVLNSSSGSECDSIFYLTVNNLDTLSLELQTDSICWDSRTGRIELTLPPGSNPLQIRWNTGATGVKSISNLDTGRYIVEVLGEGGCISKRSIRVPAYHRPSAQALAGDLFCGDSTSGRIEWDPRVFRSLTWNDQLYRSGEIRNVPVGAHKVELLTLKGCIIDTMLRIEEGPDFQIMAQDSHTVRYGDSLDLNVLALGTGGYIYEWIPCVDLSCCDCPNPVFSGTSSTYYRVIVTDSLGCEKVLRMRIAVELNKRVFVPNAITPNDDRINDRLTIFGNWAVEEIPILEVYDRWGELIYRGTNLEPNNVDHGWDGTFLGESVLPGVYTYKAQVRFVDGTEWKTGSVTVLR